MSRWSQDDDQILSLLRSANFEDMRAEHWKEGLAGEIHGRCCDICTAGKKSRVRGLGAAKTAGVALYGLPYCGRYCSATVTLRCGCGGVEGGMSELFLARGRVTKTLY